MRSVALVVSIASVFLIACGSANVVGKYKAKVTMPSGGDKNALGEGMANALASSMTLELKADKTFAMSMIFPIEGTWEMAGNTVTLHPKSMMGMDASSANSAKQEPMEFTVSDGGKTLTAKKSKPGEGELAFVRE